MTRALRTVRLENLGRDWQWRTERFISNVYLLSHVSVAPEWIAPFPKRSAGSPGSPPPLFALDRGIFGGRSYWTLLASHQLVTF